MKSMFWFLGVVITSFVTLVLNEALPSGTFSRPFRAEVYIGSYEPFPEYGASQLGIDHINTDGIRDYRWRGTLTGTDFARDLSDEDFRINSFNYTVVRLRNFDRETIESLSIRFPNSATGRVISDENEVGFFSPTGLLSLEDMEPNGSIIVVAWVDSVYPGLLGYEGYPRFLINSSHGSPTFSFVRGPVPSSGGSILTSAVWDFIQGSFFFACWLIVGIGPGVFSWLLVRQKRMLYADPELYAVERGEFLAEVEKKKRGFRASKKLDALEKLDEEEVSNNDA